MLSLTCFAVAKFFIRKGKPIGMWFHNKGLLFLVPRKRK